MPSGRSPKYLLTRAAEDDLAGILDFTTDTWGAEQAERYLDQLVQCFERIAEIGRNCDAIHTGFRRIEAGRHVIFYCSDKDDVLIARVLHQRMLPANYALLGGNR